MLNFLLIAIRPLLVLWYIPGVLIASFLGIQTTIELHNLLSWRGQSDLAFLVVFLMPLGFFVGKCLPWIRRSNLLCWALMPIFGSFLVFCAWVAYGA